MPDKWTETRYRNLLEQIDLHKPRFILEFGTWQGRTAVKMVKQALKYRDDVHYFGIDLFEFLTVEQANWENMTKRFATRKETYEYLQKEIPGRHSIFTGYSHVVFPTMKENEIKKYHFTNTVDFIFIDGGHSLETITRDWMCAESVMGKNSVVIFDDYYEEIDDIGCRGFIDFALDRELFNVQLLDPVDHFKTSDGRPQPTRMVKVTRKHKEPLQNRELNGQESRNPYLPETYAGPESYKPVQE